MSATEISCKLWGGALLVVVLRHCWMQFDIIFVPSVAYKTLISVSSSEGATFALPEAAGAASAAKRFREREAAEAERPRGEPGGKAQEDPGNERPGGLQQGHQW